MALGLAATLAWLALDPLPAAAAASCSVYATPGSHTLALALGGTQRLLLVHVPEGIRVGRRAALVLALHGVGGSGPQMERYSGLSRVADQNRFIVAYPSADGAVWNSTGAQGQPDDVAFLDRTITVLDRSGCVDPRRVFAAGVSNGGQMVALAGCQLSSEIAAIAVVAGNYGATAPCRPSRPLSVLDIHGTADPIVPYLGGAPRRPADGLPPLVSGWVSGDGCSPSPVTFVLAPSTTAYRWGRCTGGVRVEHIRIHGGRHQWPGATPPDPGPPSTICAACTIWSFFAGLDPNGRSWSLSGGAALGGE